MSKAVSEHIEKPNGAPTAKSESELSPDDLLYPISWTTATIDAAPIELRLTIEIADTIQMSAVSRRRFTVINFKSDDSHLKQISLTLVMRPNLELFRKLT